MPQFIPVLIAAILSLIVLLLAFGGGFVSYGPYEGMVSASRTINLGRDFIVSYTIGEEKVAIVLGEVDNGLFKQVGKRIEFEVPNVGEVSEGMLKMKIWNSNYYGNLIIEINGNEIYRGAPEIGEKTISFDGGILKRNNVIEVKAESSGWKIWAYTVYIFDVDVWVSYKGREMKSFNFDLTNLEVVNTNRARLLVFGSREGLGDINARLNGYEIYSGRTNIYIDFPVDFLETGTNTLDLSTEPDTRYNISSAQVVLFFG